MEQYSFTRVQTRLANLLSSRRLRFPYINGETGDFKWKKFPLVLLNTLGSCLNLPTLFYISFYVLAIYPGLQLKPLDMLSVVFFASAISILFDIFIGYIFDKFIKPVDGGRPNPGLRNIFCVLGTIGLVITLAFFFRVDDIDQAEATRQFRVTLLLCMFFFAIANCTSYKSSVNYSPFQEDRRKLFHLEYFIKGLVIFVYVSFPLWVKFWGNDCSCGDACKTDPASAACTGCITTCDTFRGVDLNNFRVTSLVFTCIFGLANIISQFAVKTRNDEDREDIATTYNRRLVEIQANNFLLKTFFVSMLEFSILFGFAIWAYYYIYQEVTTSQSCLETWGSSAYLCTKSFWLQLTVFLMFFVSLLIYIFATFKRFILGVSQVMTALTIITGILIITIQPNNTTQFCFISIFMACFFGSFAATKLIYSNGIYYDEYKSGVTQPNLPTFIFLLSVKLGFLFALAFHLTFLSPLGFVTDAQHFNNEAFGGWVVFASIVIIILKAFINNYDIEAFDKIQIAIERNINLQQDDIAFYDPIAKEPVRCPVISFHAFEKKLIKLMYNLAPNDMIKIINGKQYKVQSRALLKLIVHICLALCFTVLITVFGSYFNTPWAWLMAVGMIYIPISLIAMLHEYNVWVAATTLDSSRYKSVDRNILLRFVLFLQPPQE